MKTSVLSRRVMMNVTPYYYRPCVPLEVCREQEDTELLIERFCLVTVVGTTISTISILENLFLLMFFAKSKHYCEGGSFYFMLLALSDVFVSGTYILLMSVKILYIYVNSYYLQKLWLVHKYTNFLVFIINVFKSFE